MSIDSCQFLSQRLSRFVRKSTNTAFHITDESLFMDVFFFTGHRSWQWRTSAPMLGLAGPRVLEDPREGGVWVCVASRHCKCIFCAFLFFLHAGPTSSENENISKVFSLMQSRRRSKDEGRGGWCHDKKAGLGNYSFTQTIHSQFRKCKGKREKEEKQGEDDNGHTTMKKKKK